MSAAIQLFVIVLCIFFAPVLPAHAIVGGFPARAHTSQSNTTHFIVKFNDGETPNKTDVIRVLKEADIAFTLRPILTVDRVGPEFVGMSPKNVRPASPPVSFNRPVYAAPCPAGQINNTGPCPPGYQLYGLCRNANTPPLCAKIIPPGSGPAMCMGTQHCTNGNSTYFEYCGDCQGSGCASGYTCRLPGYTCRSYPDRVFFFDNLYPVPCNLLPPQPPSTPVPQQLALPLAPFTTFSLAGSACFPTNPTTCGNPGSELVCDVAAGVCKIPECVGLQCTDTAPKTSSFVSKEVQNMYSLTLDSAMDTGYVQSLLSQKVLEFEDVWPDLVLHGQEIPDDPYYPQQWNMRLIYGNTDPSVALVPLNSAINVAIIDTGIDENHEDLQGSVVLPGRDYAHCDQFGTGDVCIASKVCPSLGSGYCAGQAHDDNGHGTHIAGIISAVTNNKKGVVGFAPGVHVIPVKVMNKLGETLESWTYEGITYAVNQGANVINLSIGGCAAPAYADGTCPHDTVVVSPGFKKVLDYVLRRSVNMVVAAGNENDEAQWYTPVNYNNTPGRVGNILVVSATGPQDQRASYANFGPLVDISAPGGQITGDRNGDGIVSTDDCTPDDCIVSTIANGIGTRFSDPNYESHAGTSMAAPHVVGEIALMLVKNPSLTVPEIIDIIKRTADPLASDQPIGNRINVPFALAEVKTASNINYVDPQCDLCGWCSPGKNPKPANWDSCQSCLYTPSGDRTNKSYTVLGCIEATSGDMVQTILRIVLGTSGGIAFLAFLFGSYAVMTAGGNPHQVTMGKDTIVSALIGLCTILFSIFILRLFGVTIFQIPGFS